MNERDKKRRRAAFLAVFVRTRNYWPRAAVEEWAMAEHDRLVAGVRGSSFISDEGMSAWYRSVPTTIETEAKALWGRGWAQGVEVDERK